MKTHQRTLAMIVSLLGSALAASAQFPEAQPRADLERELTTMARVIEETLDRDGPENWHRPPTGASAFEEKVRWRYLAGTGAIFTVPIRYPVIEAAADKPAPTPMATPGDLWEKHAAPPTPDPLLDVPDWPPELAIRLNDGHPPTEAAQEAVMGVRKFAVAPDEPPGGGPRGSDALWGSEPFDAAKLDQLRRVLLDTIARYGRKIEHLDASERILIQVEAPSAQTGSRAIWISGERPVVPSAPPSSPTPPKTPQPRNRLGRRAVPVLPPVLRRVTKPALAYYLISVKKSDVVQEVSLDDLEKKIEERRY